MMMMGLDLLLIVLVGAAVYASGWRPKFNQAGPAGSSQTAVEILKARYAGGEISREEFEQMRRDLDS